MKELAVEDHLVNETERCGGVALKFVPLYALGFPDRIVMLPGGRIAFVELKRPGAKPRRAQVWWLDKLRALGFEALFLDTKESVSAWLNQFAAK